MRTPHAVPLPVEATTAISRCLWQWLVLGVLLSPLLPAVSGQWLGPPWFWGVAAPAASLLVFHRGLLVSAWRTRVAPIARSRTKPAGSAAAWRASPRSVKARRPRSPGQRPWSPSRAA